MAWFVYILRCENGDLYTGVTTDLNRRFQEHRSGKGGWFTKANRPVELLYHESCASESEAKRREAQIKGWSRRKKLALISSNLNLLKKGGKRLDGDDDYFYAFATYEDALDFSKKTKGAEPPLVLVLQKEHINEPKPGVFEHIKRKRIAEWQPNWLAGHKRAKDSIVKFLKEHR